MEPPQPGNRMEHAMGPVESQIGKHDDQRNLSPVRQASDRGSNGRGDGRFGGKNAHQNDGEKTELYHEAVYQQEDEIVRPAPPKHLLLRVQGEQALERHEDKTDDQNNFQTQRVHVSTLEKGKLIRADEFRPRDKSSLVKDNTTMGLWPAGRCNGKPLESSV